MYRKIFLGVLVAVSAFAIGASAEAALYTEFENLDKWLSSGQSYQWNFGTPTDFNVPPYGYSANLFIRGYFVDSYSNQVAVNGKWVGTLNTSSIFTLFASNTNIDIGQVFLSGWTGGSSFDVKVTSNETLYLDYSKFLLNYTPSGGGGGGSIGGGGGEPVHAPEPGTLVLLGSGLIGLGLIGRKKLSR